MCIFCRIIDGSAQGYRVYEDALTLAFLDTNPISDVFVGGKQVISDGFHVREDKAEAGMRAVMESLTATQAFTRG